MKRLMIIAICLAMLLSAACEVKPNENAEEQNAAAQTPDPGTEPGTATEAPQTDTTSEPEKTPLVTATATPEPTPEITTEPTPEPTEAPTPKPTPTPRPTPKRVYGAPHSFKPTKKLSKSDLPVVYDMYKMNPKGKNKAQMFTFDLNGDGKAEKISFKLDEKKNRTTITAGKIKITLKEGAVMVSAMLIDLDPDTPYTDLIITIDEGSDDYTTIPLHIEKGKFVRGESLGSISIGLGSDGVLYRTEFTDLLGTQTGSRSCYGENFTPDDEWLDVSLPTEEELLHYEDHLGDYGWFLQLKRELPCTIDGEAATLPIGTILYMTRFHESRKFAEVHTLDGVTAVIEFTMEDEGWPYRIGGVSQDEYFVYELLYAD